MTDWTARPTRRSRRRCRRQPALGTTSNARITRALHERRPAPRRFIIPSAVAAALLIAGVAGLVAHQLRAPRADVAAWDGAKGSGARAIPVRLRFLAMGEGGRIEKGISGEPVDAGSSLLFEVEAARAADLALAASLPTGPPRSSGAGASKAAGRRSR